MTSSRKSTEQRLSSYERVSGRNDPSGVEVLTPKQRRRAVHKSSGREHRQLTDPDRYLPARGRRQAYLNPQQFKTMREIRRLPAVDTWGMGTVGGQLLSMKRQEIAEGEGDTADYGALREAMRKGGPAGSEVPPVHIGKGMGTAYGNGLSNRKTMFGNGGHRVAIAADLGWKAMRYTPDLEESGYGDNRFMRSSSSTEDDSPGTYNSSPDSYTESEGLVTPRHARGARSWIPGYTGYSMPGNRWHAAGPNGSRAGGGLYTELHGPNQRQLSMLGRPQPVINPQQFARTQMGEPTAIRRAAADRAIVRNRQDVLPGMHWPYTRPGAWTGGTAGQGPFETHFPGGGRINTADRSTTDARQWRAMHGRTT